MKGGSAEASAASVAQAASGRDRAGGATRPWLAPEEIDASSSARAPRRAWLTIAWVVMIPVSWALGWLHTVVYVSALSLWALVSGHWAGWQAARVEVAQEREIQRRKAAPLEERVVDKLIDETELERQIPSGPGMRRCSVTDERLPRPPHSSTAPSTHG